MDDKIIMGVFMQRRQFLASASLAAVTTALPGLARAETGTRDAALRAMLDFLVDWFRVQPNVT